MKVTLGQAAEVRLGRQRSPEHETGDHLVPYLRSANVGDGRLDLTDVKTMNFTPREQVIFRLEYGDVLVTEGSGSIETVGASAVWREELPGTVCFQNTLLRLRPRAGITDGRFLAWWARHARLSGQIVAISSGANIKHVGSDGLKRLPIDLPEIDLQRGTADFLDDRVARIDQIIIARRAQIGFVDEAAYSASTRLLAGAGPADGPPLSAIALIIDTEHKTAPVVPDGRHWIAGTSAIRGGRLVHEQLRETDASAYQEWTVRGKPSGGDVLLTREAPVGEVALLADSDPTVAIGQRVVLIKPAQGQLDPHFLRLVLMAGPLRRVIALATAGSLHPHLNIADISRLRVPGLPVALQRSVGRQHDHLLTERRQHGRQLRASIQLMSEYKQSLITAAVTGELDVTTAGSGIPG